MKSSRDISGLIEIMPALRTPQTGCPWDLEQNFATIAPYTIEDAYEVADAIARDDLEDLRDELGDLLLQVVFHARMAQEQGAFEFADVVQAITEKMLRRHPHVFGDENADRPRRGPRTVGGHQGQREGREGQASGGARQRQAGGRARRGARCPPRVDARLEAPIQSRTCRLRLE